MVKFILVLVLMVACSSLDKDLTPVDGPKYEGAGSVHE